ncbi:Alpha/Beta hydrolase protein [Lactifluus subvellereus]|nr:Alpha/Beta hydrolase protein [Lactifluus subvellereus]
MNEFFDIPYASGPNPHPLHSFDLFQAPRLGAAPAPLICFVHGGAWCSEDKTDHSALARSLAAYTSSPVIVPNYRLTNAPDNELRHPAHAQDILQLLTFLLSWSGPQECQFLPYDPTRIFLMGHSCSAHMLACILLDSSESSLEPSSALLRAVRGVFLSEGIYDIDALLKSFPTCRNWFIVNTFGDLPTYDSYSITRMPLREGADHIFWSIIHSKGDTLVDVRQSQAMYEHLRCLHERGLGEAGRVLKNWEDLEDEHDVILQSEKFVRIMGDFIFFVSNTWDI